MSSQINDRVLTAQSALDTTHAPVYALPYSVVHMIVEFGAGTTGGIVSFEASASPDFAGTWIQLGTSAWTVASSLVLDAGSITPLAFPYVRARISTAIVGGTVNVNICGN